MKTNSETVKKYHQNYNKEYYQKNRERIKEKNDSNSENRKEYNQKWRLNNPEYGKNYDKKNRDKINHRIRNRKEIDPLFRVRKSITNGISASIKRKGHFKNSRTKEILGCSIDELKIHLESKFEHWMSWENYGNINGIATTINFSWDIDHIIPIDSATSEEELIRLNHYTNLQPLCSYTNRVIKSNKVTLISK